MMHVQRVVCSGAYLCIRTVLFTYVLSIMLPPDKGEAMLELVYCLWTPSQSGSFEEHIKHHR